MLQKPEHVAILPPSLHSPARAAHDVLARSSTAVFEPQLCRSLRVYTGSQEIQVMPTSTLTSKGQTTVPKEVREVLDLAEGDKLTWEIRGGRVAVTTERPSLLDFEGFIKNSSGDVVAEIAEARKRRGRV
jgi:antitoxin PrlF